MEGKGDVFVTDNVLTLLMCAPRTVYSWDLVITKADGKMWIDRRDAAGTNSLHKIHFLADIVQGYLQDLQSAG